MYAYIRLIHSVHERRVDNTDECVFEFPVVNDGCNELEFTRLLALVICNGSIIQHPRVLNIDRTHENRICIERTAIEFSPGPDSDDVEIITKAIVTEY